MFSNEKVLGIFQSFSSQHRLIRKKNAQPQNLYAESFRTLATSFLLIVKVGWDGRWLFYVILCRIHATTSIGEDLKTSFDGRDSDISECIQQQQFPCSLIIQQLCIIRVAQCLKITEKVAFDFASEASNVYILSGQKFFKNANKCHFGDFLKS